MLTAAILLLGAARAEAVPSVTYECTPAPQDCSGWYRSNVSIDWTVLPSTASKTGCQDKTLTTDTAGSNEFCRAVDGQTAATVEVTMKLDKTPPVVTGGQPARAADVDGWYNRAVAIAFSGTDLTSGVEACTATTYGGPDSSAASVSGACTDKAGNVSSPLGYGLKYDATAPVITGAAPERAANAAGWFNRPVRFDFQAGDATSGIADCPAISYSGPDSASASLTGSCRDRAGNASSRSFGLKYDATPPQVEGLKLGVGDRRVSLEWRPTAGTETFEVTRTPGLGSAPSSVVFRGPEAKFVDEKVKNRVRYVYELGLRDEAGNRGSETIAAVPGPRLLSPPKGTISTTGRPPLLRWTAVRGARYYNLQLFRGRRKILSTWPARPRYQLKARWRYRDERRRLAPGHYRWVVWPGFGPRSKTDYGKRIGPRTFTVVG